jgi:hypothetical protein
MMGNRLLIALAVGGLVVLPAAGRVWAQTEPAQGELNEPIDEEASTPEGEQRVIQRLTAKFNVDEARVTGLREKGLGYGEVDHALTLAERLPGGITDENVNQIMAMRQDQHMGWGKISQELFGTGLGSVKNPPDASATETAAPQVPQSVVQPGGSAASSSGKAKGHWFGFGKKSGAERGGSNRGLSGGSGGGVSQGLGGQRGNSPNAPGHNR